MCSLGTGLRGTMRVAVRGCSGRSAEYRVFSRGNDCGNQTRAWGILRPFLLPLSFRNPVFSPVALTWREATPYDAPMSRPTRTREKSAASNRPLDRTYYVDTSFFDSIPQPLKRMVEHDGRQSKFVANSIVGGAIPQCSSLDRYIIRGVWNACFSAENRGSRSTSRRRHENVSITCWTKKNVLL